MTRRFTSVLACLAVGLLAGCGEKEEPQFGASGPEPGPSAPDPLAPIAGSWSGTLEQRGMRPFMVRVTISSAEIPARNPVAYTGIDCSGSWDFQSRQGTTYRFREVIDRGAGGSCKGVGDVTLTERGERLSFLFEGGGVTSRGVLSRSS